MSEYPAYEMIRERRTVRKFSQKKLPESLLRKLINAARLAPSGSNLQPLDYLVVNDEAICVEMFKYVGWAGYIAPKGNPGPGEAPTAYIIVLVDKDIKSGTAPYDVGAAVQNMLLAAWEEDVGCCWQGSIDREKIRELFKIPVDHDIDCVVSLGYKAENPVLEDYKGSIKYWKDENGTLHVPKRSLEDMIRWNKFQR